MACQVPRTRLPPATGIVCDDPIILALRWAAEFALCVAILPVLPGDKFIKYASMSLATSGSAPSLIVIPAVVCGQYTPNQAFPDSRFPYGIFNLSCDVDHL